MKAVVIPAPEARMDGAPLDMGLHSPALCREGRHQDVRHENPAASRTTKGGFHVVPTSFPYPPPCFCLQFWED